MLIGIMGKMGSGKTLSMTILSEFLSRVTGVPLYANYTLKLHPDCVIDSLNDVVAKDSAIMDFDEMWLSADARVWKDNVKLSHWVNQTRKKKMIVFYTTQHIRQMEMRIRNATDLLIYCEKTPQGHWLQFIDWQYRQLGRKYLIPHNTAKMFHKLYDTYEVLKPLQWDRGGYKKTYEKNHTHQNGAPF